MTERSPTHDELAIEPIWTATGEPPVFPALRANAQVARGVAPAHSAAIDRIELTVQHEGIGCSFERVNGPSICDPGEARSVA